MHYFDTHAHLDDERFSTDLPEIVIRAQHAGVNGILAVSTDIVSTNKNWQIAKEYIGVYPSAGIHPNSILNFKENSLDNLKTWIAKHPPCAIGEIGLDRYWQNTPFEIQTEYFIGQLEIAANLELPVIIHCRDAWPEMLSVLESRWIKSGPIKGIMHSFCGDQNSALECLKMGLHLSFSGMVTYKKNTVLREIISRCPIDKIHAETDSPYLTPEPHRGKKNDPSFITFTVKTIAEALQIDLSDLTQALWANACQLFRVNPAKINPDIPKTH